MKLSKNQLKQIRYLLEYLAALPFLLMLKVFPLSFKTAFGNIAGRLVMYPILKYIIIKRYKILGKNLEIVLGKKNVDGKKDTLIKDYCSNTARIFTEGLGQQQMTKHWLEKNVDTSNIDILLEAHKNGGKIIVPSAHIGNWEVAHKYLYEVHNIKTTIIYRKQNNLRLDHAYVRERSHVDLIEKRDPSALKKMIKALSEGNIIVILLDQRKDDEEIDFFGKKAWFATSISRLAIKQGASVICGHCVRTPSHTKPFTLSFEKPIQIDENTTPKSLTQKIFNHFEIWITKNPTQWFCLIQDIWREKHHILEKYNNIVVKVGSNTLMYLSENNLFPSFVQDIKWLQDTGKVAIVVSSGAIATARKSLNIAKPKKTSQKQALSSIGQVMLMHKYHKEFDKHKINIGQILVTNHDIENKTSLRNLRLTIAALREMHAIPVLNENDAISTEEIKIGDNDTLSAHIAKAVGADLLIILTDVDGVYDSNPNTNPNAKIITRTNGMETPEEQSETEFGTGGITTKIKAGNIAVANGFDAIITNGRKENPISSIRSDECTLFTNK